MLLMIAVAALAGFEPSFSSTAQDPPVLRIVDRSAIATAEEWNHPSVDQKRKERLVKDERGHFELQRVFEFE